MSQALWKGPSESSDSWTYLDGLSPTELTRLLLRCGEGDVDAFDTYYRLTSPVLATLLAARRVSPTTADTVLVQAYVTIWQRADTFSDSSCSVWQWTLTILLEALDALGAPSRGKEPDMPSNTSLAAKRPMLQPAASEPYLRRRRNDRGIFTAPKHVSRPADPSRPASLVNDSPPQSSDQIRR